MLIRYIGLAHERVDIRSYKSFFLLYDIYPVKLPAVWIRKLKDRDRSAKRNCVTFVHQAKLTKFRLSSDES